MAMRIRYEEQDGTIVFCDYDHMPYIKEAIPTKIQHRGKEAIQTYAERRVGKIREEMRRANKNRQARRSNLNVPVSLSYNGITLRGAILEADQWNMRMRMDEPFQITDDRCYGTGVAPDGNHFDDRGHFTDDAIIAACRRLLRIYHGVMHEQAYAEEIALVRELNASMK